MFLSTRLPLSGLLLFSQSQRWAARASPVLGNALLCLFSIRASRRTFELAASGEGRAALGFGTTFYPY